MRTRATLVAVLFLAAACGGTTPSAAPESGTPPSAEATPGPESPAAQAACPEVPEPTGTPCFDVAIVDFAFDPPSLRVSTTARVVFTNQDGAAHSIQWSDGTPTSPSLGNGASTDRTFTGATPGTIAYVCGIHGSSMSGEIVIDDTIPIP